MNTLDQFVLQFASTSNTVLIILLLVPAGGELKITLTDAIQACLHENKPRKVM